MKVKSFRSFYFNIQTLSAEKLFQFSASVIQLVTISIAESLLCILQTLLPVKELTSPKTKSLNFQNTILLQKCTLVLNEN